MTNKNNRPQNMSQLDYLWVNFGSYSVSDSMDTPESIPTTEAIKDYVEKSEVGIVKLDTETLDSVNKIRVFGIDKKGNEITSILLDKNTRIISFVRHSITQEDIDNGYGTELGEQWLVLETSDGDKFWVSINDLILIGQETNTIKTQVIDSKIASQLKINNPIVDKSVELQATDNGLRANLIINDQSTSKVLLIKGDNGVETKFTWEGTDSPVGFKFMTFAEYQLLTPEEGVIYFLTDQPSIWFNGIKFSSVGPYVTQDDMKEALESLKQEVQTQVDDINKQLVNKVDWTDVSTESNPNRKSIVLGNNDLILGTDTSGSTYNIAMLSKYNVIDLGTSKLPINLNTPANTRPTVQEEGKRGEEAEQIAYLSDFRWKDV